MSWADEAYRQLSRELPDGLFVLEHGPHQVKIRRATPPDNPRPSLPLCRLQGPMVEGGPVLADLHPTLVGVGQGWREAFEGLAQVCEERAAMLRAAARRPCPRADMAITSDTSGVPR